MSAIDVKDILQQALQCKADGLCMREQILNSYLAARVDVYEQRMQALNEKFRADNDLPRCPPVCEKEVNIK